MEKVSGSKNSSSQSDEMKELILKPESKFLKIVCTKCRNEQIIFNKAASVIKCLVCGSELAEPRGGKSKIKTKVTQVFE